MLEVGYGRAYDGLDVHAGVIVELIVFHGEEGERHELGQLIERDEKTPFAVELTDHAAVAGEHGGHERGPVIGDLAEARQIVGHPLVEHVAAACGAERAEQHEGEEEIEKLAEESALFRFLRPVGRGDGIIQGEDVVFVGILSAAEETLLPFGVGGAEVEPVRPVIIVPVVIAHGSRGMA